MCVSFDSRLSSGILLGSLTLSIALGEMFASEIGYTPQGRVAGMLSSFPFYFIYARLLDNCDVLDVEINLVLQETYFHLASSKIQSIRIGSAVD
jgi:hypothetical protein